MRGLSARREEVTNDTNHSVLGRLALAHEITAQIRSIHDVSVTICVKTLVVGCECSSQEDFDMYRRHTGSYIGIGVGKI